MTTTKKDWGELKKYLLAVHKEYQERNGLPYCKNCGVDFEELSNRFESFISLQKKDLISWCKKEKKKEIKRFRYMDVKAREQNRLADGFNLALSKVIEKLKEV